jgi:hypothetical protein
MKPSSVNMVCIGAPYPPIVDYCIKQNSKLCASREIPFTIHAPARDFNYPTPGIQAESVKLMLHTRLYNALVIDWDVELIDFTDLDSSGYPYLGVTPEGNNDLFLSYCNTYLCHSVIDKWIDCFLNIESHPHCYSTGIIFTNVYKKFTLEYPSEYFRHYRTMCGFYTTENTYSSLSPERQSVINTRAKSCYQSSGKIWPI